MTALLPDATWIVLTGAVAIVACAVPGAFLVLRRLSLLGDAISHAVLPGIVLAVLLTGHLGGPFMLVGAATVGVLASAMIRALERSRTVERDASLGITFTGLFALGVVMIALFAGQLDIDQECVLYGDLVYTPLDPIVIGGVDLGPRALATLLLVLAVNVAFVTLCWKELLVTSFDPHTAETLGVRAERTHYMLMGLVSLTVVAAFESVGAILVVAMLVVPAATAQLLVQRLAPLLWVAALVGVASAVLGYGGARAFGVEAIAAAMTVAAGALFLAAFLLAPEHGLLARAATRALVRIQVGTENLLGELARAAERDAPPPSAAAVAAKLGWSRWLSWIVLWQAERRGLVEPTASGLRLCAKGHDMATRVRDAHRGWQQTLEDLGYDREHAHASAHRLEHVASPDAVRREAAGGASARGG